MDISQTGVRARLSIKSDSESASHAFTQAAVIVQNLFNYLESENQRVIFLESPMVRRILESSSS